MARKKIVIIDDSELVLAMVRDVLEEAGFEVVTATNGIEANRQIFNEKKPDLIILDVMMPLLEGGKKAKLLKGTEYTNTIPILYLSSKPKEELARLVEETGAEGYVCKPFTDPGLLAAVEKALARADG